MDKFIDQSKSSFWSMDFKCSLCLTSGVYIDVPAAVFLRALRELRINGVVYRLAIYCCCDHYLSHRHYILAFGDLARGCEGFYLMF